MLIVSDWMFICQETVNDALRILHGKSNVAGIFWQGLVSTTRDPRCSTCTIVSLSDMHLRRQCNH